MSINSTGIAANIVDKRRDYTIMKLAAVPILQRQGGKRNVG